MAVEKTRVESESKLYASMLSKRWVMDDGVWAPSKTKFILLSSNVIVLILNRPGRENPSCKLRWSLSTFFIILLAISLGALYIGEMSTYNIINNTTARIGAVALGGMSLVFSCIVMYNVIKLIHHGNA